MITVTPRIMRIVILFGLPGVGKLTIAKGLARLRGYRVFHNHLIFDAVEAVFPFGSPRSLSYANDCGLSSLLAPSESALAMSSSRSHATNRCMPIFWLKS